MLAIEGTPNFVDCRFCRASLRIVRTASATFTEVRKEVKAIGAKVSRLQRESKLRAVDDRWREQQDKLAAGYGRGGGSAARPTTQVALIIGLIGGGTTVALCVFGLYHGGSNLRFGISTGMATATITLLGVSFAMHQVQQYERAERAYLAERRAIERENAKSVAKTKSQSKDTDPGARRKKSKVAKSKRSGRV